LFKSTKKRLTILYTGLMTLFLLTFTALSYFILSQFLYHDSKEKVLQLAHEEAEDHAKDFLKWEERKKKKIEDHDSYDDSEFSRSFYFLVSRDGELVKADAPSLLLEPSQLNTLVQEAMQAEDVHFVHLKAGDRTIHLVLAGNPVFVNGNFVGTAFAGTDISEQKHIMDRLLWILFALSILFLGLSSLISYFMAGKAMNPIMQAFRRQQEFVADASHELRTPLSVVHSSLEVLAAEEKKQMSDFSQQVLDDLQDEVERMEKLITDLLTLARVDSGVIEIVVEPVETRPLLESLSRSFQHLAAKKNIQLNLQMESDFTMYADPERMRQLFYILLDNALRYTPSEGTISIQVEKASENTLRIAVSDTGIGIAADQQNRIFDRFYRADKARSREQGGTGLGLSIAQWIVQAHGGTIAVESMVGQGTSFVIQMPVLK